MDSGASAVWARTTRGQDGSPSVGLRFLARFYAVAYSLPPRIVTFITAPKRESSSIGSTTPAAMSSGLRIPPAVRSSFRLSMPRPRAIGVSTISRQIVFTRMLDSSSRYASEREKLTTPALAAA